MIGSRKAILAALSAGAAFLAAASASAQSTEVLGTSWRQENRSDALSASSGSPQSFAFEFRFGPYSPRVDREFNGKASPYKSTFGTGAQFYFGLEGDYLPLRIPYVGLFGAGFGWGYTTTSAFAKLKDGTDSNEETSLSIMPMYGVVVLRADELMRRTGVPIVPYAKFGFGFAPWKASDGLGKSSYTSPTTGKVVSKGGDTTLGLHLALGGMLSLSFIDPRSVARLDESTGVNHIYLFGEWMDAILNGLGSRPAMRVGTSTFIGGFALDM